jgi:hypothetical protein
MKEATCLKCGDIYNPDEFGELHYGSGCRGEPTNECEYGEKVKTSLTLDEILAIIESEFTFDSYIEREDTHADIVALDLIGDAYKLDADNLHDEELLSLIEEILAMRNSWRTRNQQNAWAAADK